MSAVLYVSPVSGLSAVLSAAGEGLTGAGGSVGAAAVSATPAAGAAGVVVLSAADMAAGGIKVSGGGRELIVVLSLGSAGVPI